MTGLSESARLWRAVILESRESDSDAAPRALLTASSPACLDILFDGMTFSPLIGACIADRPWLVATLLRLGASPDFPDDSGWTPLHWCCKSNRPDCARALLAAGADPNATHPREASSCLHLCVLGGSVECARLLAAHGADADRAEPLTGASARHWASHHLGLSLALGVTGAPRADRLGRTCLHWAARMAPLDAQALSACLMWVGLGVDPAALDAEGRPAAEVARGRGLFDCAAYLDSIQEGPLIERAMRAPAAIAQHGSTRL